VEIREGMISLKLAADQNYVPAQMELAYMYQRGKNVVKDLNVAEKWFEKAAMNGIRWAMVDKAQLMSSRVKSLSTLIECYGWMELAVRHTKANDNHFVNHVRVEQLKISIRAKDFGLDEKEFIARSKEWAKQTGATIPIRGHLYIKSSNCKYLKKDSQQ
jgi:TPR repeat protein